MAADNIRLTVTINAQDAGDVDPLRRVLLIFCCAASACCSTLDGTLNVRTGDKVLESPSNADMTEPKSTLCPRWQAGQIKWRGVQTTNVLHMLSGPLSTW